MGSGLPIIIIVGMHRLRAVPFTKHVAWFMRLYISVCFLLGGSKKVSCCTVFKRLGNSPNVKYFL